jgi:predicted nuclease of restriction endonuclease-like (RecB) superfamily
MTSLRRVGDPGYSSLVEDLSSLLDSARRAAVRTVNTVMTATYWQIGRRIVEHEQGGAKRAAYGKELIRRLARDLTVRFGRGFGVDNLELFRAFYLTYPSGQIRQTVSGPFEAVIRKSATDEPVGQKSESLIRKLNLRDLAGHFPLSWTHYVHLMRRARSAEARHFYEAEVLRGGWSVRQLDRQIASQFYERTALSRNKNAMLTKGAATHSSDAISADDEVRDPLVLEFLGLKDEYSESDLEEALIRHLESFLLELGGEFAFIGRQRRLRIGDEWYRVDLLFFHRRLRCLVVIDLKVGKFTHADAGQMHLYLNYAREHWVQPDENPPVGLILCSAKDDAVARYALEGLPSKVLAREYRLALPAEKRLAAEIEKTRQRLESHHASKGTRARRR